jgi:rhodanese-related sulfurtransferase
VSVPEITPAEFVNRKQAGAKLTLLDVREDWELKVASVPDVVHIPMGQVPQRLAELDSRTPVVVLCRSGRRSLDVATFLLEQGYDATNLAGGILAWSRDLDPSSPTY